MGLNSTPSSDRVHIGFFGMRNAGKSSVVNAVTGQDLAVVSDVRGRRRTCEQSDGAAALRAGGDY
mgnify:FL=1